MKAITIYGSVVVLALATAACSQTPAPKPSASAISVSTPTGETGPAGFSAYYTQSISWEECGDFECAKATAPMSWQDPKAGEIEIALKRHPATGKRTGSLLVNPGGPGVSAVDGLADNLLPRISDSVQAAYDIVAVDPRGVGSSSAVECLDDKTKDKFNAIDYTTDDAGVAKMEKDARDFAKSCVRKTGDLLAHVDTQSAARDMDMLRAALGDSKLSYVGFSYGTQLGATYAGLFPGKTGRLVLDGAVDMTETSDDVTEGQAAAFEAALRTYIGWCQTEMKSCPLGNSVDEGAAEIKALFAAAQKEPLPTSSDRAATKHLISTAIIAGMYDDGAWPYLTAGLTEAIDFGSADTLLLFADSYNERDDDGSYANQDDAQLAISCLDRRGDSDTAAMKAQAARIQEEAPTMGEYISYSALACKNWPYPVVAQDFDLQAKGAAPIVVIGTTGDPATPYKNAQALASTLDSGVLVTYQGEGHTAYGNSNACVNDAVDEYLLTGTAPADGLTC